MKRALLVLMLLVMVKAGFSQQLDPKNFNRADTLRGMLTPLRTNYDLTYYHLDVKVDPATKLFSGSNLFKFRAVEDFNKLQFDLFANLKIEKIEYQGKTLNYTRELNAVYVEFPQTIKKGNIDSFKVYYSATPAANWTERRRGAFTFTEDSKGKPWITTSCQGLGASSWWPTKEHQQDEVDSMLISITVPKALKNVSNGRLRKVTQLKGGLTRYDWYVNNPINNYNVSANIGDYVHFGDSYQGESGKLDLDFWVLKENLAKAKTYFPENVKPMLKALEHWFGPYPFYEDSYKIVDVPYAGMEHQSNVAYGNHYKYGYNAYRDKEQTDLSNTGWGLKFDYIIIHESGHEWFGNSLTAKDVADNWIQESFTMYSEALFLDYHFGKKANEEYVHGLRSFTVNDRPVQGLYDVQKSGSKDMYPKGAILLNMVRTIINDDAKWRDILRGLNKEFYKQTVDYNDIVGYINKQTNFDFTTFFQQYLQRTGIPTLEVKFQGNKTFARWVTDVPNFTMPVKVRVKGGEYKFITPTRTYTEFNLDQVTKDNLEVDNLNYYIGFTITDTNIGPGK